MAYVSSYLFAQLCFLSTPPPQFNIFPFWQLMRVVLSTCAVQLNGGICCLCVSICSLQVLRLHFSCVFSLCVCCGCGSAFLWRVATDLCSMGVFFWSHRIMLAGSLFLLAHLGAFSGVPLCNIRSGLSASLHLLFMCLCTVSLDISFLNPSVCLWAVCGHVLQCRWVCQSLGFSVLSCLLMSVCFSLTTRAHLSPQALRYHFEAGMRKLDPLAPSGPTCRKEKGCAVLCALIHASIFAQATVCLCGINQLAVFAVSVSPWGQLCL